MIAKVSSATPSAPEPSSGTRAVTPARFGRYVLLGLLGRGGMADVHLALVSSPGAVRRLVVVKTPRAHLLDSPQHVGMFLDEARALSALAHPNLLQIHDTGFEDAQTYIAAEYLDGLTLSELLSECERAKTRVPVAVVVKIVSEVAAALAYAHQAKALDGTPLHLVHRDVSPPNVMVLRSGIAKLIDFGVAKTARNVVGTEVGHVKGKFRYVAPELVSGERPSSSADVWSLGVLLWECLTGRRLFRGKGAFEVLTKVRNSPIVPPSQLAPDGDATLDAIVLRALDRSPETRCSMRELHADLVRWLATRAPHVSSTEVAAFVNGAGHVLLDARDAQIREWLRAIDATPSPISVNATPDGRARVEVPPPPPLPSDLVALTASSPSPWSLGAMRAKLRAWRVEPSHVIAACVGALATVALVAVTTRGSDDAPSIAPVQVEAPVVAAPVVSPAPVAPAAVEVPEPEPELAVEEAPPEPRPRRARRGRRAQPRVTTPAPATRIAPARPARTNDTLHTVLARARDRFRAGDFHRAAVEYAAASRMSPSDARIFAGLGAARLRAGDRDGAARAYRRAMALAPGNDRYRAALASLR
ncbi:serine/threonine protein kinase [Sandaracinus amylolyticus]|uniref:non-specific serine/threonine protein kinase n=1 Tax=Sandaracinus amylolyticus TaxID=927083 RepID=A0A0F6SHV1_9BACT|nr:serine/threonine protein kinase [Sandaracinus amylolyticus]